MRHRRRPMATLLALVAVAVFIAAVTLQVVAASASPTSKPDVPARIAADFPDRKTSSNDSQRLVSYLRGQLSSRGWLTETLQYSTLVKSVDSASGSAFFTEVSGENVLAVREELPASRTLDLLLVAPYDTFLQETGVPEEVSYTARATGTLLSLATALDRDASFGHFNLGVAFVSGHYQYGAGMGSLIEELTVRRGLAVRAAVVLGDIDALESLPLTIGEQTPVNLVQALHRAARENNVPVTVVGPRTKEAWYRAVMTPGAGAFSVASMLDAGQFKGEAQMLLDRGIPAITLGTPRSCLLLPLNSAAPDKVEQVIATLASLVSGDAPSPAGGPTMSEHVVYGAFGNLYFIPTRTLLAGGAAAALVAAGLVALHARRVKDLGSLALLGAVLLAMAVAHPLRTAWFSGDPRRYAALQRPHASLFLYMWTGLTVVALGAFRIWRIRARIAYLHSKTGSYAGSEPPAPVSKSTGNWAGPWGSAVMAAALVGTSLLGSESAVPTLAATLVLSLAVLVDRPERFPRAVTLPVRLLGSSAVLPAVLWAGSPLSRDAARIYSVSAARLGIEAVVFTASLGVLIACVMSAFRLPEPVPGRMVWITVTEVLVLAVLIAVGITIPRTGLEGLPACAAIRESFGGDARVILDVTRPLGDLQFLPPGTEPAIPGTPARFHNRGYTESVRLGVTKDAVTWASIGQPEIREDKREKEVLAQGQITAELVERPAYYQITFRDIVLPKSISSPFMLVDLPLITGPEQPPVPVKELQVEPKPGYSVTFTWWMPSESSLSRAFSVTRVPASSAIEVTGRAVYLDRSYLNLCPSAPNTRFVHITVVSTSTSYR